MVKWVAIGRSAGPWLIVSKVDGGTPSNEVASADRASVGKVMLANWQKAMFVWALNMLNARFRGVQCGHVHHLPWTKY
jgi:hypothetical protein